MHSRNNDVNIYVYIMRHIFCCIGVRNFLKFSGSKKKICQTYFEIGQTYFLFAPMWGKRSENQFSFFSVRKAVFGSRFPRRRLSALVRCGNGCLVRTKVSARP